MNATCSYYLIHICTIQPENKNDKVYGSEVFDKYLMTLMLVHVNKFASFSNGNFKDDVYKNIKSNILSI